MLKRQLNNLAALLASHARSRKDIEEAYQLVAHFEHKTNSVYLDTLAMILMEMGDTDRAISVLRRAVNHGGGTPIVYYHLGLAYLKKGDKAAARIYLSRALDSGQEFSGARQAGDILDSISLSVE